ncbi:hypothetical protein R6U77_00810 [Lysinibacillus louembei]|uniref:Uncharacterized protein n=1 Tax=Lysinibacillus louembei TaxID=1470088 RepID=A0ABZ0RZ26_9BACI|nr:hypothetical protein [Lysinibacillus louembei]WPK12259.1 hypothetical protein R6U77_00810 [Lysinibacillus louembei]
MPIVKNEDGTVSIEFGTGDVNIGSGMMGDEERGLITFVGQEPKPIGHYVKHEEKEVDLTNFPIYLVFKNTESLDVLIERLKTTRKYMTGELDVWND